MQLTVTIMLAPLQPSSLGNTKMPYIEKHKRPLYTFGLDQMASIDTPGDLNYIFTWLIIDYINTHGLRYSTLNDIVGALICAKDEFTRRVVVPYEDRAIGRNGDIY